jgi:hypothetical protein
MFLPFASIPDTIYDPYKKHYVPREIMWNYSGEWRNR